MTTPISIHWFRRDLRLADNPALLAAVEAASTQRGAVLPIYILDDHNPGKHAYGGASRWWLHHSLLSLQQSLADNLSVYCGDPQAVFDDLLDRFWVENVYWNRCYEPWAIDRDTRLKAYLKAKGVEVQSYNASLLWEPWSIHKDDGTPYRVFTPFYRKGCLPSPEPRFPLPAPQAAEYRTDEGHSSIAALGLLPTISWDTMLEPHWSIGEQGAKRRFAAFLDEGLSEYKEGRNLPAKPYVSRLSAPLHFGEISPNQLWYAVRALDSTEKSFAASVDHFCSELGWREFSHNLLYHNPDLPQKNLQTKFDAFPWQENAAHLKAWQQGRTGIPMVDAGMRELWQTGYMHNRVRMIVGSFLVKNLLLHWHHGERWFHDTLVDADLANNSASWQWIAGCGADAAPYFRIFNPVTQGKKFDPEGSYIRRYIPEIAALPNLHLFSPWEAPAEVLEEAGITLGVEYPLPVVQLKPSRERALAAFGSLRENGG